MTTRLPDGFRVALRPDVERLGDGRLLVGGSPLTALWLSETGARHVGRGPGSAVLTVSSPGTARLAERLLATNLAEPVLESRTSRHDITVVIPVRDRAPQLDRALAGLAGLDCIVVDDASHDVPAVREVVERHGARLVSLQVNVGPAGARNAGLAQVRTPFVAFVDSDVSATAEDLVRLAAHFDDPGVALVGPLIRGVSRSARPRWFERYEEVTSSLTLGTTPASVRPGASVAWLPSACLAGRTEVLRHAMNGFDASMRVGEDVDLVWRLVAQGAQVRYDPAVVVRHDTRGTLADWAGRKYFYGTGSARLARRHGCKGAPADLSPVLAVAAFAVLARHPAAVPLSAGALLWGARAVRGSLTPVPGRDVLALRLSTRGFGWALRQESALLLRHWWPAVAVAAVGSRTVRRAVVSALVVDTVLALRSDRGSLGIPTVLAARRVDDLAYGAGLWVGSVRARTLGALAPRWTVRVRRRPRDTTSTATATR